MALVNMSRNFDHLRRVSDDRYGKKQGALREEAGDGQANYVDDTDAGFKAAENIPAAQLAAHFNDLALRRQWTYQTRIRRGQWDSYWI